MDIGPQPSWSRIEMSHAGATGKDVTSLATGAGVRPAATRHGHDANETKKIMKQRKFYLTILALAAGTAALAAADANALWEKNCQKCHGANGNGDTKMGKKLEIKDFTDAKYQASFTDAQATKAIKEGIKDGDKTRMKANDDMSDDDIKALVAKVRAFKK
jgi:mono/diheme cytochrome c family protein